MNKFIKNNDEVVRKLYDDIRKLIDGCTVGQGLNALTNCIALVVVHTSIEGEIPVESMVKEICADLTARVNLSMDNYKKSLTEYVV